MRLGCARIILPGRSATPVLSIRIMDAYVPLREDLARACPEVLYEAMRAAGGISLLGSYRNLFLPLREDLARACPEVLYVAIRAFLCTKLVLAYSRLFHYNSTQ